MWHEGEARNLTQSQRDMLVAHIDGPVVVVDHGSAERGSRTALISRELLRGCLVNGLATHSSRPPATALTDDGRMVLAWILAGYVDDLIAAGMIEAEIVRKGPLATQVNLALTELRYRRSHEKEPAEA